MDDNKMQSSDIQPEATAPRVLLVSYHFQPDLAIGARRPTALAQDWVKRGAHVTVVAGAVDKAPAEEISHAGRLRIHRIKVPPRLVAPIMIYSKRMVRALLPSSGPPPSAPSVPENAPVTATESARKSRLSVHGALVALARYYNAFEDLIDSRKLWSTRVLLRCLRLGMRERFDVIVVSAPPMSAMLAAAIARAVLRVPLILDFRDVWPDPWLGPLGTKKTNQCRLSVRIERALCLWVMRGSSRIATSSPGISERIALTAPWSVSRTEVVLNGYDPLPQPVPDPPHGRLLLLYCGSIYLNRNPFPLLEAVRDLIAAGQIERDKVRITFAGDCTAWQDISIPDWIARNSMNDIVQLLPMMPLAKLMPLYAEANVLINFAQAQREAIPGKTYEYMALRRDSLVLTEPDSSTADVVRRAGSGLCVEGNDLAGLRQALLDFYARHVLDSHVSPPSLDKMHEFSRDVQNQAFWNLMQEPLIDAQTAQPQER